MKTYSNYIDYFENLIVQCIDFDHVPEDNKKAFFSINLEDVLAGQRSSIDADGLFFVLSNYIWKPADNNETFVKEGEGMFFVLGTSPEGDIEKEKEVLDLCEKAVTKIINRIRLDSLKETKDENSFWYGSQDQINIQNILPLRWVMGNNQVGLQVVFKFASKYNPCVNKDDWADKDTDESVTPYL